MQQFVQGVFHIQNGQYDELYTKIVLSKFILEGASVFELVQF